VRADAITASFVTTQRRSDIEGLRALAVVVVLLFHAFPKLLPFGYLGVDIFFVISGFVITQSLLEHSAPDGIALRSFYARRVRRLFPALALVMASTLALGWFVLLPEEYSQTATLGVASSFSAANLRLLYDASYFDVATTTKPLMHLWSLGVEEQFYLVWPIALLGLIRSRRPAAWVAGAAAVSLIAYLAWAINAPTHAFYNPVGRAWELLAGALLVWLPARIIVPHAVFWVGSAMLFAGVGAPLSALPGISTSPFADYVPLVNSMLAVAGTAGVIAAGRERLPGPILSSSTVQWLGRISYPLYLWHWPGMAVRNLLGGDEITAPGFTICWLLASLVLADRTHAWIERPVAARPTPKVTSLSAFALALPLFVCALILLQSGLPEREVAQNNPKASASTSRLRAGKQNTMPDCMVRHARSEDSWCARDVAKAPDSVVWGDSKGDALYWGLVRETRGAGLAWMLIGSSGCPASEKFVGAPQCAKGRSLPLTAIAESRVERVVLVAALRGLMTPESRATFEQSLREVVRMGKSAVVVVDNPTVIPDRVLPTACARNLSLPWLSEIADQQTCSLAYAKHVAQTAEYLAWLRRTTAAVEGAVLFDPTPLLCDIARNDCSVQSDGQYLYSYGDHISDVGNSRIARAMVASGAIRTAPTKTAP
jgi:peptidoglycan/LPS O-acetylase OafA/YrhL